MVRLIKISVAKESQPTNFNFVLKKRQTYIPGTSNHKRASPIIIKINRTPQNKARNYLSRAVISTYDIIANSCSVGGLQLTASKLQPTQSVYAQYITPDGIHGIDRYACREFDEPQQNINTSSLPTDQCDEQSPTYTTAVRPP